MTRHPHRSYEWRIRVRRAARAFMHHGTRVPQPLQAVELAYAGQHHVHDDVLQIDQHPLPLALALGAERPESIPLGLLDHVLRDGAHMPVGGAGSDDQGVGDISQAAHVQYLDVHGFHVFEGGSDGLEEGRRAAGRRRRGAGRGWGSCGPGSLRGSAAAPDCAGGHVRKESLLVSRIIREHSTYSRAGCVALHPAPDIAGRGPKR